jgi:hypothetical protein
VGNYIYNGKYKNSKLLFSSFGLYRHNARLRQAGTPTIQDR